MNIYVELTNVFLSVVVQPLSDPTLSTLSSTDLQSILAVIQFTNLDSCTNSSTMPDQVRYTLRMQEYVYLSVVSNLIRTIRVFFCRNGANYFHAQSVKISENDYLWKRSPQDFCRGKNLN